MYSLRGSPCLLLFAGKSLAVTVFTPNCTVPSLDMPYIIDSSNVRSTLDILWSCLSTLLISTWAVQHLNVPMQKNLTGKESKWGRIYSVFIDFYSKLKWMALALILPEFLVGRAVQDFVMAHKMAVDKGMKEIAAIDGRDWTILHAFYANMGGFILKVKHREAPPFTIEPTVTRTGSKNVAKDTGEVSRTLLESSPVHTDTSLREKSSSGHNILPANTDRNGCSEEEVNFHANSQQIYILRCFKLIEKLPSISRNEIQIKSRADVLVKATAVGQAMWLVISVIARAAQQLPIAQLEVATLAFSACAFVSYGFLWHKPQDVTETTIIGKVEYITPMQLEILQRASGVSLSQYMLSFIFEKDDTAQTIFKPIANDTTYKELEYRLQIGSNGVIKYNFVGTGVMLGSLIFGAIHCVAWNNQFPSLVERELWRVASLVSTCILIVHPLVQTIHGTLIFSIPIIDRVPVPRKMLKVGFAAISFLAMVGYIVARLYLIAEMFRSLFFLPQGAFLSSWPSMIPHIS